MRRKGCLTLKPMKVLGAATTLIVATVVAKKVKDNKSNKSVFLTIKPNRKDI